MRKRNIKFRIPQPLHKLMLEDLKRPHAYAYERVGFLYAKTKYIDENDCLIIAIDYKPVDDGDYEKDKTVGAKINSDAIRKAMQGTMTHASGCFHVHLHHQQGKPRPSSMDSESLPGVVDSLVNIARKHANGFLILSADGFYTEIKIDGNKKLQHENSINQIGYPMAFQFAGAPKHKNNVYDRQSFLGKDSQFLFENIKVGIIGYGGGGSHIGQQLAHMGVKNIIVFDDDIVENTNLNRLIGAWFTDVKNKLSKTAVAKRIIKKIMPSAVITTVNVKWQKKPELLQTCDVVFGCVDSYMERKQLEAECRRYLIPLIDIGMDVSHSTNYLMSGQVILSMPGTPCLSCYGFLTEPKLAEEAGKYGNIGGRPQVVWPNGVLASTAVGVFVDLVTGWTQQKDKLVYLAYDGNVGTMQDHPRKQFAKKHCSHYPLNETGPVIFSKL